MMGMGPVFDGMGLINTIYSYGTDIAISFTCDRKMMPDPANYAAAIRMSFEELRDAVRQKEARPAPPKEPRPAAKKVNAAKAAPAPKKAPARPSKPGKAASIGKRKKENA